MSQDVKQAFEGQFREGQKDLIARQMMTLATTALEIGEGQWFSEAMQSLLQEVAGQTNQPVQDS